jgi:glycosyltransferase involved in cell wall biosynthesis
MTTLVSFRPGVVANRTAFEAMAQVYRYLQKVYDYEVVIVKSTTDDYADPAFDVVSIPPKAWKPVIPHIPTFPRRVSYRRHIDRVFDDADAILTVDPTIYPQGILGIRRAVKQDLPVWFDTSLTVSGTGPDLLWEFERPIVKRGVQRTTGIIATVPKCMERFREIRIFDADIASKFTIMGHPVDTETFVGVEESSKSETTRVLAITRLVPEKGVYYILEAMDPLLNGHDELELAFLGSGPMESLLKREIRDRELGDSVEVLDTVPHENIPDVLNSADIFVNHAVGTSRWEEFFGVANLEAMACELPCIVTDCGGIPYTIREKERVIVVEQRNVVELREALARLIDSRDEREKLAARGREYVVDNYAVPAIAERYHEMLQRGFRNEGTSPQHVRQ